MCLIYRIFLCLAFSRVLIYCHTSFDKHRAHDDESDYPGEGSAESLAYDDGDRSPCTTDACRPNIGIIIGSVVGGILGLAGLATAAMFYCNHWEGRPRRNNSAFVSYSKRSNSKQKTLSVNPFRSGTWSSRYYLHGIWYGPHWLSLSFDHQLMKVSGSGSDHRGGFSIDGTFSSQTQRVGLTTSYQIDANNLGQTSEHQMIIQLTWSTESNQFEGKWYVQMNKHRGEDKFELRYDEQDGLPAYEEV